LLLEMHLFNDSNRCIAAPHHAMLKDCKGSWPYVRNFRTRPFSCDPDPDVGWHRRMTATARP